MKLMKRLPQLLLLTLLLTAAILWISTPQADAATVNSGTCGDNLTWTLDDAGTLTISGTGPMTYYGYTNMPWYNHRSGIKNVVITNGVTVIGNNAFNGCTGLTSVTFPDSVRAINGYTFSGCTSLTSVTIPESVTFIGSYAFSNCTGLTDVYYDGPKSQWEAMNIISTNTSLLEATLHTVQPGGTCGDNLTWALDDAGTLTISGTGPMTNYTVITMPWYSYRSGIKNAVIGDGVTSIGNYAFAYHSKLASVTIPASVTTIGNSVFYGCTGLTNVTIPNSVTTIGASAFRSCTSLKEVSIPQSVTSISSMPFCGCTELAGIWVDAENPNYSSDENGVLFNKNKTRLIQAPGVISDYVVPEGVTRIDARSFDGCCNLSAVTIPASVANIYDYAFYNCTGLTDVYYDGPKSQWEAMNIISTNTSLLEATLHTVQPSGTCGDNLTWTLDDVGTLTISGTGPMEKYASTTMPWYSYRIGIKNVVITNGVTTIGTLAFSQCRNLKTIEIPDSVITIGPSAFLNCTGLTFNIYGNAKYLGSSQNPYYALIEASSKDISSVIIHNDTKIIGANAFVMCDNLTSVTIPDGITDIDANAFAVCDNLSGIWVDENNSNYSNDERGVLFNKEKTVLVRCPGAISGSYVMPQGVTEIENGAFFSCRHLTSVTIPDGVTNIGIETFAACRALTSVTIPGSITSVGKYAFDYCTSLTDVYYTGTQAQWDAITIGDYNEPLVNTTIHFLSGIVLKTQPDKIEYIRGEALDTTGLTLTAKYSNGMQKEISEGFTVTGFDPDTIGARTLTVNYQGFTATFTVTVKCLHTGDTYLVGQKDATYEDEGYTGDTYCADCDALLHTGKLLPILPLPVLKIVSQPASVEITAGFTEQFSVEAVNAASYKWQYRRNENAPWVNTTLGGNNTDTLSVPAILSRNGYQYRCRITGTDGKILYTEPATLTVLDSITVTTQPTRQIVNVDANATFTVQAEGAGLTYQWLYRKSDDDFWKQTGMEGNKTNTLTVPALLARNGYQYMCAITDENGIKINSKVAELSALGFTSQPKDRFASEGAVAKFSVTAEGQDLSYQWQYRKTEDGNWMSTSLTGFDTDTLMVPATTGRNGYQYRCLIADALGIIRYSDVATLTVE